MALGPFGALMGDGMEGNFSTLEAGEFLSGLTPGASCKIFAYSYFAGIGGTAISAGGATATVVNTVELASLVEGKSYARLAHAKADKNGNLQIFIATSGGPRALNGFQIRPVTPVSEPATSVIGAALATFCANQFAFSRKRRIHKQVVSSFPCS